MKDIKLLVNEIKKAEGNEENAIAFIENIRSEDSENKLYKSYDIAHRFIFEQAKLKMLQKEMDIDVDAFYALESILISIALGVDHKGYTDKLKDDLVTPSKEMLSNIKIVENWLNSK